MKRHLVSIFYNLPHPYEAVVLTKLIPEVLNERGKPVVFPRGLFKSHFGKSMPNNTIITIL